MSTATASAYVADGYLEDGKIEAVEGLHPAINFKFRPIMGPQWAGLIEQTKQSQFYADGIDALAVAIKSWDVTDGDGKPVAITKETLTANIRPQVIGKLLDWALGWNATAKTNLETSLKNSAAASPSS
jgi:hypothetical protein